MSIAEPQGELDLLIIEALDDLNGMYDNRWKGILLDILVNCNVVYTNEPEILRVSVVSFIQYLAGYIVMDILYGWRREVGEISNQTPSFPTKENLMETHASNILPLLWHFSPSADASQVISIPFPSSIFSFSRHPPNHPFFSSLSPLIIQSPHFSQSSHTKISDI